MALLNHSGERIFPSWTELLERAATKLTAENKHELAAAIRGVLPVGGYQQAADYARQGLQGGLWDKFFKDNFSVKRENIDEASLELPRAIWRLGGRIITLNYDRILRFTCPNPDDLQELDNSKKNGLADFYRDTGSAHSVWHLHGSLENLENIIFSSESYSKLYNDHNGIYQTAIETFRSICNTTNLLFIGCGLDDAELLSQLARAHSLFSGNNGPHYALVPEKNCNEIKIKLKNLNIEIITFSNFGKPLIDSIGQIIETPHAALFSKSTSGSNIKLDNAKINLQSLKTPIQRIAVLICDPIGEKNNYDTLLADFKSLKCEVVTFPLNTKTLNDLQNFNYLFILSSIIKGKIMIEDDDFSGQRIDLLDLESRIGNERTDGLFIFQNQISTPPIDTLLLANLSFPTFIIPAVEFSKVSSLAFKIFRKREFSYFENGTLINEQKFKLEELSGKYKGTKERTPLPDLIDPKTTKNYVGRSVDLENICREIVKLKKKDEILTIKGSGGIGKTITVKKIAVAFAERNMFGDGIDFIDCEFIADYATFEKKIAANFSLENASGIRKQIKENFEKQNKLIILDNVETLLHLSENIAIKDFISFICEYATIVITSRELLKLECENVYELRSFTTDEAYELFCQQLRPRVVNEDERKYIRQNIVETLLDNNPLAIKLIASNIPKSKSFQDLKQELEEDFFRKANETDLATFDAVSDINIERKKSLYASINFSYRHLNDAEKIAFELMSLFPDGIDMESLKRLAENRKTEQRIPNGKKAKLRQSPIITDSVIKSLEDKSMIQVDRRTIKLQSIVGKFAEYQLKRRSSDELSHHYRNAISYNMAMASYLVTLITDQSYRIGKIFTALQGNFFKSIKYIEPNNYEDYELLNYLDDISSLSIQTSACGALAQLLEKTNIKLQNELSQQCCEIIIYFTKYHAGDFKNSLNKIREMLPLNSILINQKRSDVEELMIANALAVYRMEGEEMLCMTHTIKWNTREISGGYSSSLFKLGVLNLPLLEKSSKTFFTLEAKFAVGLLTTADVENYLNSMYKNNFLGIMEGNYLKSKLGFIDRNKIKKLVSLNSYTLGLQQLMLAMSEESVEQKNEYFEQSLSNLMHIKYYYVEALLIFSMHLYKSGQTERYNAISKEGLDLACLHHYRWLRYNFEKISVKDVLPYNSDNYPLPDNLDFTDHMNLLIKGRRNQ